MATDTSNNLKIETPYSSGQIFTGKLALVSKLSFYIWDNEKGNQFVLDVNKQGEYTWGENAKEIIDKGLTCSNAMTPIEMIYILRDLYKVKGPVVNAEDNNTGIEP